MKESLEAYVSHNSEGHFLNAVEKKLYREDVFNLLAEYPENFFTGHFEALAKDAYNESEVVVAIEQNKPVGCLFFNRETGECDWLAVSKSVTGRKSDVAKKMFQSIFDTVPNGTKVFWYINTEDAVFEGRNVGTAFEPGRRLYREMGASFTRIANKFGEGNHAYLIEIET